MPRPQEIAGSFGARVCCCSAALERLGRQDARAPADGRPRKSRTSRPRKTRPVPPIISGSVAEPELIQDEPLTVTVPAGLQPLDPQGGRPGRQPDHQGEVRAGPAALLRPPGLARRHGELRHLPQPGKGWTDGAPVSTGIDGQTAAGAPRRSSTPSTARRCSGTAAPRRWKARPRARWSTRSRWATQKYKEIVDRLRTIPGYKEQFQKVFGTDVTLDGMAKAIATFERVAALSGNSKYDKYNAGRQRRPHREREAGHGPLRPPAEHRRRVQARRRASEGQVHHLPRRRQLHRRAVPQPGRRLGRERRRSSPTSAAGPPCRSAPRPTPSSARSRPRRSATSS